MTEEQALATLKSYPLKYYNEIHPKHFSDILDSHSCSMIVLKNETGETHARALMAYMISDLIENINVGKTMNDIQVARACDLILDEFYFLKVDDFKLCFNRVLAGKYGQSYDRVDVQVLFGWLNAYCNERMNYADESSYNEHLSYDKTIPIDGEVLKRLNSLAEKYGNNGSTF